MIDIVILQSVFTHMFEAGIGFYRGEFRRILKRNGRVYATCFIVDDAIRAKIRNEPATTFGLTFQHARAEGCFINDPLNPVAAVAYTLPKMQDLIARSGFRVVRPFLRGSWSGMFPEADCGQDTMILGEPRLEADPEMPPSDDSRPPSNLATIVLPETGDRPGSGSIGSFMAGVAILKWR